MEEQEKNVFPSVVFRHDQLIVTFVNRGNDENQYILFVIKIQTSQLAKVITTYVPILLMN